MFDVEKYNVALSEKDVQILESMKVVIAGLADYLGDYAIAISDDHVAHLPWARTIWDVTAIGWLLNKNGRYMHGRIENVKLPGYDGVYHDCEKEIPMCYVDRIYRNPLMGDLINKLIK